MDIFIPTANAQRASLAAALAAAGLDGADAEALAQGAPALIGRFEADREAFSAYWRRSRAVLDRLPPKPRRDERTHRAADVLHEAARAARIVFLEAYIEPIYRGLTADLARYERLEKLVYDVAELVPGLLPSRADVARDLQQLHAHKDGFEIDQGLFVARLMAREPLGLHLCHAMMLPLPDSARHLDAFARTGRVDLGKASVERRGAVAIVTMRNPGALNAEDGSTVGPLETAVDIALLDPASKICVLRGGAVQHPKFAGRRLFGAGLNLTDLYHGKIPFMFYLARDMGLVNKMYRGLTRAEDGPDETLAASREKLWIAAVEEFAIGGHCQLLLVMDYIIAARGAYATLPARKEGIIPGMANMRMPRFVGDRITRQAIQYGRRIDFDTAEGRLIADEIVAPGEMDQAIRNVAEGLISSGAFSAVSNRRAFRIVQEPLTLFCRYLSVYAREQAHCLASPALIANLERFWDAANKKPKG